MNTCERFVLSKDIAFMEDLGDGYISKTYNIDGENNSFLRLYDQPIHFDKLKETDKEEWLWISVKVPGSLIKNKNLITKLPTCFVDTVFVRNDGRIKNREYNIEASFPHNSEIRIKFINCGDDDFGSTDQNYSSEAEDSLPDAYLSQEQDNLIKLSSLIAVSLTKYRHFSDTYEATFDYSTHCLESWGGGAGLFDKAHQNSFKSYCEKLNNAYKSKFTGKNIKIFTKRKHHVENKWRGVFALIGSVKHTLSNEDNDPNVFQSMKNLDDVIFRLSLIALFKEKLVPNQASNFIENIIKNALSDTSDNERAKLLEMALFYLRSGSGLNEFLKKFPDLRKTSSLLLFASSDNYTELGKWEERLSQFKLKLGREGIWSYWMYYVLQNSYSGIQELARRDHNGPLIDVFKQLYERLLAEEDSSDKTIALDEESILGEEDLDGNNCITYKSILNISRVVRIYPGNDKAYRMLKARVLKPEYHSYLERKILEYVDGLGLIYWPGSLIKLALAIKTRDSTEYEFKNNTMCTNFIPIDDMKRKFDWVDWDAFLVRLTSKEKSEQNKIKKLVTGSGLGIAGYWEELLLEIDKEVDVANTLKADVH